MPRADRIAFIAPRFAEGGTVGGAETLLKNLADHAAAAGRHVTFLTTCAQSHFSWENTLPAGRRQIGQLDVHFFPVDPDRDVGEFLRVQAQIDRTHHVVCVPAADLVSGADGQRCFAYSGGALKPPADAQASQVRADVINFVNGDLSAAKVQSTADANDGTLSFPAEQLFVAGTATLSPGGQDIARKVAASLAQRMPCYGYGAPASGCNGQKMTVVNVLGQAGFDAFTDAGRQAAALSLQRSVAFHQALTAAAPVLGQLTNAPTGGQPLLRVATYGQSDAKAAPAGAGQTITIQFVPAG